MSNPVQTHFPGLPPPLKEGEVTGSGSGLQGGKRANRATSAGKSSRRTSRLPEALAGRLFPCPMCGKPVEDSEFSAFYQAEPRSETSAGVVAMNIGHARCREDDNTRRLRRVSVSCGCVVLAPTLVRVVSCGYGHEIGTVQVAPVYPPAQRSP